VSTLNHRININFQTNTSQLEDARKKLKELEKLYDDISSGKATPGAGGLQNITAQINQQKANIKIFERENALISAQNQSMMLNNQQIEKKRTLMERASRAIGQAYLEAPLYATSFALMNYLNQAFQAYVKIDQTLTRIAIVTEKNTDEIRDYAFYANEAGKALGVTGQAFMDASLIFLQQGGYAADYADELAEASIKLSNITMDSRDSTSEYVTAIANSFKLLETDGAAAAGRIVDVLAALDAASGSSANEIAEAFKKSASSIASAGFEMEEGAAMIAVISETTRQAPSMIGTGLKTIIGRLGDIKKDSKEYGEITSQIQDALKDFGISFSIFDEATGDMKQLPAILSEIQDIYSKTGSTAVRNALIEAVAGKEQRDRFIALVENQDRYNELLEIARDSSGAADRAQEQYIDSITAKLEQLQGEFEQLVLSLFDNELIKDFIDQLSAVIAQFNQLNEGGNAFLDLLIKIAAQIASLKSLQLGQKVGSMVAMGAYNYTPEMQQEIQRMQAAGTTKTTLQTDLATLQATPGSSEAAKATLQNQILNFEKIEKGTRAVQKMQMGLSGLIGLTQVATTAFQVFGNETLTVREKGMMLSGSLISGLGTAIAPLFGPAAPLVLIGSQLAGMAFQFFAVDKEAQKARDAINKFNKELMQDYSANREEIKQLAATYKQLSEDTNRTLDQENQLIEVRNQLAQNLKAVKVGTDEYGNSIILSSDAIQYQIILLEKKLALEEKINKQKELEESASAVKGAAGQIKTEQVVNEEFIERNARLEEIRARRAEIESANYSRMLTDEELKEYRDLGVELALLNEKVVSPTVTAFKGENPFLNYQIALFDDMVKRFPTVINTENFSTAYEEFFANLTPEEYEANKKIFDDPEEFMRQYGSQIISSANAITKEMERVRDEGFALVTQTEEMTTEQVDALLKAFKDNSVSLEDASETLFDSIKDLAGPERLAAMQNVLSVLKSYGNELGNGIGNTLEQLGNKLMDSSLSLANKTAKMTEIVAEAAMLAAELEKLQKVYGLENFTSQLSSLNNKLKYFSVSGGYSGGYNYGLTTSMKEGVTFKPTTLPSDGEEVDYVSEFEKEVTYRRLSEELASQLSETEKEILKTRIKQKNLTREQFDLYLKTYDTIKKIRGEQERSALVLTRTRGGGFAFRQRAGAAGKEGTPYDQLVALEPNLTQDQKDQITKMLAEGDWDGIANLLAGGGFGKDYVVKSGDTLGAIAKANNTTVSEILKKNPEITNANKIDVGQVIKLAEGGLVKSSVFANIGEAGQELVLPLERNTDWMDMLALKINGAPRSENSAVNVTNYVTLPNATADEIKQILTGMSNSTTQWINKRKSY
jgi:TP901 family phage tail tape measure protein